MGLFKKRQDDDVAWYRHRNYKGSLSEDQKMELDSIRWQSKSGRHPAAKFEDLPDEVQDYIAHLEVYVSDTKFVPSLICIISGILFLIYCAICIIGLLEYSIVLPSIYKMSLASALLIILGSIDYRNVKNILEKTTPDSEFLKNWEIDYISKKHN